MANLFRANKKGSAVNLISITITTQPTKRDYARNDVLDLTGIVVTGLLSNGNTADITSLCTFSPANGSTLSTGGVKNVTAEYAGLTATTTITVFSSISVTTAPTKYVYAPNDNLNLTGLKITGTAGSTTKDVTSDCTSSPIDGTPLTTIGMNEITVSYLGLSTKFYVNVTSSALENYTWSQIRTMLVNGTLGSTVSVGATKTIKLSSNEIIELQLASINDGTGTASSYYPNHTADFVSVGVMDSGHRMNSTNTNVGGWNDSQMRTYLNETVYPTLPSDLRAVIVEKTHMRTEGNQSSTLVSASDKLWLPTHFEIGGSGQGESSSYNIKYSIFTDNASRKKYRKSAPTNAQVWWLSSPYISTSGHFTMVISDGSTGSGDGASYSHAVVLCLRIG